MSNNDHHTFHYSLPIISNHHQITNLEGCHEWGRHTGGGQTYGGGISPQCAPVWNASGNLSEYKHHGILTFIIFDCRNSNAKDADDNRKRCLNIWLILAGILIIAITFTAMIMSIYLLVITITMPTKFTGENKVPFLKLIVYSYTSLLLFANFIKIEKCNLEST